MAARLEAFNDTAAYDQGLLEPLVEEADSPSPGAQRPRAKLSIYLAEARKTPLLSHDELIDLTREAYVHRYAQMEILSRFLPCVASVVGAYAHHRERGLKLSAFTTGLADQSVEARDSVLSMNRKQGKNTVDDAVHDEAAIDAHCSLLQDLFERVRSRPAAGTHPDRFALSSMYLQVVLRVDELQRHADLFAEATDNLRRLAGEASQIEPTLEVDDLLNITPSSSFAAAFRQLSPSRQKAFLMRAAEAAELLGECGLPASELLEMRRRYDCHAEARSRCINAVVESNLLLAAGEALKLRPDEDRLFDMCQEANHGLLIAADRFAYWRGLAFSTYAVFWIRQRILRARDDATNPAFTIPCSVVNRIRKVLQARNRLAAETGGPVSSEMIAQAIGAPRKLVDDALLAGVPPAELDASETGFPTVELEDGGDQDDAEHIHAVLAQALETIPNPKRAVFEMLWGLGRERTHTVDEVADHFGMSKQDVRRAERHVVQHLRKCPHAEQLRDLYSES